jgi:hypothetical protein
MLNQAFVSFFNAAAGFSDAVYAADPHISGTLRPEVSEGIQAVSLPNGKPLTVWFTLDRDGAPRVFSASTSPAWPVWPRWLTNSLLTN